MLPNFIYIPAEGDKSAFWLNLSLVGKVSELPDGSLVIYGQAVPLNLTGHRADVLRLHLQGQSRPQTFEERYPALSAWAERLDRHTERREPQLPNLPDPVIVPPAVREFDEKVSARGTVA